MTDHNTKHVYLLLDIVVKNGNVKRLTHEGLSFQAVAELTNALIVEELLIYEDGKIKLSEKGHIKFAELGAQFKQKDKSKWIEEEKESRADKFSKDFIYLPAQKDLDL